MFGICNVIKTRNYDLNQQGRNLELIKPFQVVGWNAICSRQIQLLSKAIPITLATLSSIHSTEGAISKHLVAVSSLA